MDCIKVALCDDDEWVCREVTKLLEEFSQKSDVDLQVEWFCDGQSLLEQLDKFSLILLDIGMPEMDGIAFGREAKRQGYQGKIIMLTGYPERFREVFEFQAFRFVIKPIEKEELFGAVQAYLNTRIGVKQVSVYRDKREIALQEKEIYYIRSENGGSRVFTRSEQFRSSRSLDVWEGMLDDRLFVRNNRQVLVNVSYIVTMGNEIELTNNETLQYSRRKKRRVQQVMDTYDLYYR